MLKQRIYKKEKRYFKVVEHDYRHYNIDIKLPERSTKHSAGYDFFTPISFNIPSKGFRRIYTDIKAFMQPDEVLNLYIRSSLGIKKNLMLCNSVGVCDSDYFENEDNDGNIIIALYNYGEQDVEIEMGERIMQGIFQKYLTVDNDSVKTKRIGGVGSTGIK